MPNEELLEFIHRRFPTKDRWLDGNCYWFAQILNHWFSLKDPYVTRYLVYDVVCGHFYLYCRGWYYDWNGAHEILPEGSYDVRWDKFEGYDDIQYDRIRKDCLL